MNCNSRLKVHQVDSNIGNDHLYVRSSLSSRMKIVRLMGD